MRKILFFILLIASTASAQSIRWQTFEQSIDSADVDTAWFAFRAGLFSRDISPDSMAIVPPENTVIDETPYATFQQIAGTAADSSITYAKPVVSVDGVAYIIANDSVFVCGSTFAAPSTPNTFGNGDLYGKTLTFNTKRFNGVIFITKVFDKVTGSKKFRWGLGTL
jgi:hypothetical protein